MLLRRRVRDAMLPVGVFTGAGGSTIGLQLIKLASVALSDGSSGMVAGGIIDGRRVLNRFSSLLLLSSVMLC